MIRSALTIRDIERMDAARLTGLAETEGMAGEPERMKYIRAHYFPFGLPANNWPAYAYWKSLFAGKREEVRV